MFGPTRKDRTGAQGCNLLGRKLLCRRNGLQNGCNACNDRALVFFDQPHGIVWLKAFLDHDAAANHDRDQNRVLTAGNGK